MSKFNLTKNKYSVTEIDMKGRWSAGQKVLGSIIIRLALAETFWSSCGILALDEPTTNLDGNNIEGLVEALAGILEEKKSNENFQLIIITHDNNFIDLLGRNYWEYFWKIARDRDGYSTITKTDIKELS